MLKGAFAEANRTDLAWLDDDADDLSGLFNTDANDTAIGLDGEAAADAGADGDEDDDIDDEETNEDDDGEGNEDGDATTAALKTERLGLNSGSGDDV